ncbi:hypothetical protein CL617_00425 [archaeon]|nr:hypothetical protein [archaeon]|tara:strand:+ start:2398 stop:2682 length:285 start_codon:yes stop_codon:yes gene_type:complete
MTIEIKDPTEGFIYDDSLREIVETTQSEMDSIFGKCKKSEFDDLFREDITPVYRNKINVWKESYNKRDKEKLASYSELMIAPHYKNLRTARFQH